MSMDKEKGPGGMCVCEGRVSFFIKRLYIQNITRVDIGEGKKMIIVLGCPDL